MNSGGSIFIAINIYDWQENFSVSFQKLFARNFILIFIPSSCLSLAKKIPVIHLIKKRWPYDLNILFEYDVLLQFFKAAEEVLLFSFKRSCLWITFHKPLRHS